MAEPDSVKSIVVSSVGDLIQRTTGTQSDQFGPVFRGHADMSWSLASVLFRSLRPGMPGIEQKLIAKFRNLAWSLVPDPSSLSFGDWLAIGRHHQLPTRLLDWSESPLVAAWFAVSAEEDVDGCVWMLRPEGRVDLHTITQAFELAPSDPYESKVTRYDPPVLDPRFRSQLGLFTVDTFPEDDDWIMNFNPMDRYRSDILTKFVIEKTHKSTFRRQLDRLGIDAFSLFPDLDGLGQHLGYQQGY